MKKPKSAKFRNRPYFPAILTPAELGTLLSGPNDVETLVWLALQAFAGLREGEIRRLSWDHVAPGVNLSLPPEIMQTRAGRFVPILPVLDAWLRPFCGTRGPLASSRNIPARIVQLFRKLGVPPKRNALRNSYCAYRRADTRSLEKVAQETGRPLEMLRHSQPMTAAEARLFFSFTPEAVGIGSWPSRVADYLELRANQQTRRAAESNARAGQSGTDFPSDIFPGDTKGNLEQKKT
jgi:integrase